jgi:hypothetical protein
MNRNFAALVLTHGRPDNVATFHTLRRSGYTGPIYLVIDDQDRTADRYRANFGAESVIVFDKRAVAATFDRGDNFDNLAAVVYARNASFAIARDLGLTHHVQLDDDYNSFLFRDELGAVVIKNLDRVFDRFCDFIDETPTTSIAFSQGGDHMGGFHGVRMKRKAMNSFFCRTDRPFNFLGTLNEDVNTYTTLGSRGSLFFTFTGIQLNQAQTQKQAGGMTSAYLEHGTYVKSFSTVLFQPSSVRVTTMGRKFRRMHHQIRWGQTVPKIIRDAYRKTDPALGGRSA